jgi:amino acid transporter
MTVDSTSSILAQANAKGTAGGASASPFVVAIQSAGIQTLPSIINAMLYMFTVSASNSDQYIATRTLYSMAMNGNAPRVFKTCNKRGAPWVAFAFTGSFMGLSFLVASSSALTVFNYLASTVTLFAALAWISIFASHIAFMRGMKAQGIPRSTLVYRSPLQPYLTYYGMFMTLVISVFKGFDAFMPFNLVNFITNYIAVPVYVFGYIGYKLARRTKYVRVHEMDLNNNGAEFDDIVVDEVEEELLSRMNWHQRIWHHIKNW